MKAKNIRFFQTWRTQEVGTQWSAKGNETILRPVSQLLMRQNTIPLVSVAVGEEVV
jgi:hypothetical protein